MNETERLKMVTDAELNQRSFDGIPKIGNDKTIIWYDANKAKPTKSGYYWIIRYSEWVELSFFDIEKHRFFHYIDTAKNDKLNGIIGWCFDNYDWIEFPKEMPIIETNYFVRIFNNSNDGFGLVSVSKWYGEIKSGCAYHWGNTIGVTHFKPIPEVPKIKTVNETYFY